RERLVLAAQVGEIGAGARAIFEKARFPRPQIHDAAFVYQIVGDALDEAGVGLRMLISGGGTNEFARSKIDVEMALARSVYAIGPMQAGVEPLRRVGRSLLCRQHVAHLFVEGARVVFRIEIAALPAPISPGPRET